MDAKTILEQLKEKFEGVSEAVLKPTATKLAKTIDDESALTDEIAGVTIQGIIDSYTDSRVTNGVNTALRRERAKAPTTTPTEEEPTDEADSKEQTSKDSHSNRAGADEAPAWAKAFLTRLGALEADATKARGAKRAEELRGLAKDLPASVASLFETRSDLGDLSEEDYNALREQTQKQVNEISQDFAKPTFGTPLHRADTPKVSPEVQAGATALAKSFAEDIKAK